MKKHTHNIFCLRNDLKKLTTAVHSKHSSVLPKFPLALKSLTSRTILRKQQGLQTTITMIA